MSVERPHEDRLGTTGGAAKVLTWTGTGTAAWSVATGGAPATADYLVGTAQGGLSAEIVVGTTPGGELGGTWASPTVDATHSGSSHAGLSGQPGSTDVAVADGGTGASTASGARTNLGLVIGTDVDAFASLVSQAEAEAGTATTIRNWTAERVKQAIAALASGSGIPASTVDAKGDLIVGTANDTVARLTAGANDTILMADSAQSTGLKYVASQTPSTQAFSDAAAEGTADTYARGDHKHGMMASPGGGGALVLLEPHTASASATLDFSTFISSTYDEYLIEGVGIAPANNAVGLLMRVGTGAGPTYDAGTNYDYASSSINGTTAAHVIDAAATQTAARIFNSMANNAGYGLGSFSLRLSIPQSTSQRRKFHGTGTFANTTTPAEYFSNIGAVWTNTSTAMTALRFLMSAGNIASGTIRIYGIAK